MTTPFATSAPFTGADPGTDQFWRTDSPRFWLGKPNDPTATPDAMMIELPQPNPDGYQAPPTLGEVVQGLMGGGAALTIFDSPTRQWTITWPRLAVRDFQVINGFYRRLFGNDPWCYVQPEDVNHLTAAQSMTGGLHGVLEGWAATVGTAAFDATVSPILYPAGVLRWTGAGLNSQLVAGLVTAGVAAPDPNYSCPYIAAEPFNASVYVAKASGTASARLQLLGLSITGAVVATVNGSTTVLTTGLTQLTVSAAANALGASAYVVLTVQSLTAAAPNLLISAAQLEKTTSSAWALGGGVPRVNWTAPPGRPVDVHFNSAVTMTLSEVFSGAA